MDIDWPAPKRRRLEDESWFWKQPTSLPEESAVWGLCDALSFYAQDAPLGQNIDFPRASPTPASDSEAEQHRIWVGAASPASPASCVWPGGNREAPEPLLRALTQLANAAAAGGLAARHRLVAECQVHAPLLRLMQPPWCRDSTVMLRCCRLLHWLAARAPDNRDVLATYRGPSAYAGGPRSISFVATVLAAVEAHQRNRELLGHALRALAVLLPCPAVREELARAPPKLLACVAPAAEVVDPATFRILCRWWPGASSSTFRPCCPVPGPAILLPSCGPNVEEADLDEVQDVQMTD